MEKKRRLMGIFTKSANVRYRVNELFNALGDSCQSIFHYDIIDPNNKETTCLLTFFCDDYDKLKNNQEYRFKPITLHRKQNNILMTLNAMNLLMGSENPEENKDKKLDVSEFGENKLFTRDINDKSTYKVNDIILVKKFFNRNLGVQDGTTE